MVVKKGIKASVIMSNETRSRFLNIQAQTGLEGSDVFEHAIELIYKLLPNDRDARVNMQQVVSETLEKLS